MAPSALADAQVFLDDLHRRDRARAQTKLDIKGRSALSEYERQLLELPSAAEDEQAHAERERERTRQRDRIRAAVVPTGITWRLPWMAAAAEHVVGLCVDHGITVRRSGPAGGRACLEERSIAIPMLTDPSAYAVALHELAHIIDPEADSRQHRHAETTTDGGTSILAPRGEAAAWSWAVRTATTWARGMQDRMLDSLTTYAAHVRSQAEADAMIAVLRAGALAIADEPLTFGELDQHCRDLRGACPATRTSGQPPSATVTRTAEPDIAALSARIKELESRPAFADRGIWDATTTYQPGHGVTHQGSFWLAQRETRGDQPGGENTSNKGWRLAVKRGRDGKDLR